MERCTSPISRARSAPRRSWRTQVNHGGLWGSATRLPATAAPPTCSPGTSPRSGSGRSTTPPSRRAPTAPVGPPMALPGASPAAASFDLNGPSQGGPTSVTGLPNGGQGPADTGLGLTGILPRLAFGFSTALADQDQQWFPITAARAPADNGFSDPNADVRPGRFANTVLGAIRGSWRPARPRVMTRSAASSRDPRGEQRLFRGLE